MSKTAYRAAIAALGLSLGSCAATFNEPINLPVASNAAIVPPGTPPNVGGNTVVALAFSGGGTRAAAFAYGAMRGPDRLPAGARDTYFDRVIFISGVSGGVGRRRLFRSERARRAHRLSRTISLEERRRRPQYHSLSRNLARGFGFGVMYSSRLAGWLDQNLYEGATLADLYQPGKPIVWLNASDLYNRTPFLFSPVTFEALCSDPRKYPISQAVAASAAVPVAFVPIVLASFSDACSVPLPPWVDRVLGRPECWGSGPGLCAGTAALSGSGTNSFREVGRWWHHR